MDLELGETQLIIHVARQRGLPRNQAAYLLATAYWETAHTMEPVRETLATSDEQAIARLDRWWETKRPSWVKSPYWRGGFFGRGYVQLTHERNYRFAGERLNLALVKNPSLALEAETAAQILVVGSEEGWFTGKKLGDYLTLKKSDYVGARRIINGTDKAQAIAELARDYEAQLVAIGYGEEKAPPIANEHRDGTPARTSQLQSKTQLSAIGATLALVSAQVDQARELVAPIAAMLGVQPDLLLSGIAVLLIFYIMRDRRLKWLGGDR